MHGDFSLDPFQYRESVSRVLVQQGRVQLDSDANEQTETLLRFLRWLASDIIGPHGGVAQSFEIGLPDTEPKTLQVRHGVYYVDGIRVELPVTQENQRSVLGDLPNFFGPAKGDEEKELLYYLDVFERHVSSSEDATLREVALLGPDTASRAVIAWQIRTLVLTEQLATELVDELAHEFLNEQLRTNVRMRAQAAGSASTNPCIISPEARYRGTENRLFRVEIHDGGEKPTFKWSPDNGSVVYPVSSISGSTVLLSSLGDARAEICENDWVEVVDDDVVLTPKLHPLIQVARVHRADMKIELVSPPPAGVGTDPDKHPILRRWASNAVEALQTGSKGEIGWIELDDGVQIQFSQVPAPPEAGFRPGDYWLIPTRTAEGQVLWPRKGDEPEARPPHGIDHHYAPLARMTGRTATPVDLRRSFQQLAKKV